MFSGLLRPGQGFQIFEVLQRIGVMSATARPETYLEPSGTIRGILVQSDPKEVEQWKQDGHPITHTVIQRWDKFPAKATDVLQLKAKDGKARHFLVQGVKNPGELGHFTIYFVLEREDLV